MLVETSVVAGERVEGKNDIKCQQVFFLLSTNTRSSPGSDSLHSLQSITLATMKLSLTFLALFTALSAAKTCGTCNFMCHDYGNLPAPAVVEYCDCMKNNCLDVCTDPCP
jgi:hypothetical protein